MHSSSLNHTFRLVWSACAGAYVVVAEITRGKGKGGSAGRIAAVVLAGTALGNGASADTLPGMMINGLNTVNVAAGTVVNYGNGDLASVSVLINAGTVNQNADDSVLTLNNTGTINNASKTLTAGTYNLNQGSVINANLGAGAVNANGTVALNGTSNAETFNLQTGTTTLGAPERLRDTAALTVASPATLNLGGAEKIGSLAGRGSIKNQGSTLSMDSGNFSGVLSGTGGLTKLSAGSLVLSGANTYTGDTTVSAGQLVLAGGAAPSLSTSTALSVSSAANLVVNGDTSVASLTSSGLISGTKTLTAPVYSLNNGSEISAKLGNAAGNSTANINGGVIFNESVAAKLININAGGLLTITGGDLLSHDATVNLANAATLALTGGNQAVDTLNSSGTLKLNGYQLSINSGTITGNTASEGGTLTKSGAGTLTMAGTNLFSKSTRVNSGLLFIAPGGTLDTNGTVVSNGATLVDNGTITNDVLVSAGGTFMGNGRLSGNYAGYGNTSPGNSPGVFTIAGNYEENGNLQIEIGGLSGPGVNPTGHDQVAVGGKTTLNAATSALQLIKYTTFEPAKGDKFTIIQGTPGSISGTFASFSNNFNNDMVFNRSTGELIGTGLLNGSTGNDILNALPGASSNLKAMIKPLSVGDHQYAGGDLLTRLLAPGLTAAQVEVIGNRASPEAYAGLSDYADRATRNYTDSAITMTPVGHAGGLALFAGYTNLNAGSSSSANQADFSINSKGSILGARVAINSKLVAGAFVAVDSGSVTTDYLNTSLKGKVYGVFGEYAAGAERKFIVNASLSNANFSGDGSRITAGTGVSSPGQSFVKGLDTTSKAASLGLKFSALESRTMLVQPEVRLSYVNSQVSAFTEANANALQALSVQGQNNASFTTEAAINGALVMNSQFSINARVGLSHNSKDASRDVVANVANESQYFTVRAPGMGKTAFSLGIGVNYKISSAWSVGASYRASIAKDAQRSDSAYVSTILAF